MNNDNKNKREDSEYEEEINKLSIGDIDAIFSSAAAKENSEDIEDVLKRELRLRAKIDEAEKKLEEGREKLNEMATKKKEELVFLILHRLPSVHAIHCIYKYYFSRSYYFESEQRLTECQR